MRSIALRRAASKIFDRILLCGQTDFLAHRNAAANHAALVAQSDMLLIVEGAPEVGHTAFEDLVAEIKSGHAQAAVASSPRGCILACERREFFGWSGFEEKFDPLELRIRWSAPFATGSLLPASRSSRSPARSEGRVVLHSQGFSQDRSGEQISRAADKLVAALAAEPVDPPAIAFARHPPADRDQAVRRTLAGRFPCTGEVAAVGRDGRSAE